MNSLVDISSPPLEKRRSFPVTETSLAALLTLTGYVSSYAFQFGYFRYFGAPSYLIEIGVSNVLEWTAFILIYIASAFMVCEYALLFSAKASDKTRANITLISWFLFAVLFPLGFIIIDPTHPYLTSAIILLLVAVAVTSIVTANHSHATATATLRSISKIMDRGAINAVEQRLGKEVVLMGLPIILASMLSYAVGVSYARDKIDYFTTNTNPSFIIIGTFSSSFVGMNVTDEQKGIVGDQMKFIGLEQIQDGSVVLTNRKIGPLRKAN
jgi:hypothetical protein